jgi:predicted SAM-dependent methyltransferase
MEHVYDVFSPAKEMHRVLKPGGYVIAEVPNNACLKYRSSFYWGNCQLQVLHINGKQWVAMEAAFIS